ncbi:RNA recognition motif containing protein [Cladophialophora carrionii]|uniref:RNA recognition motif containing protein n=1 Tax=Cladophialophora carrionii TaxID=86049 RepID=A0A1C1CK79_9EURO|nr:RNA recognition motif containing protein [Cladophialophora carrionii]
MADFDDSAARYEDDRGYERRDRSASPRGDRDDRNRSRSPNGRDRPPPPPSDTRMKDADDESINTGSNLFVTGIHPRLTETDVSRLFEKYGDVENCSIMLDPHTKESRGFGFVKMVSNEQAEAAKEGLQGEVIEGRTLSIEKARRARPRTPTPGKYFGPPKRGDFRGPSSRGGYRDRYDDRRGGYPPRRDDYRGEYRGGDYRGGSRYDDDRRGYGGRRDDSYGSRGIDRYESSSRRDDGYGGGGGGGGGNFRGGDRGDRGDRREYYDRAGAGDRGGYPPAARDEAPRDYAGGRDYARDDRYAGR